MKDMKTILVRLIMFSFIILIAKLATLNNDNY